jgi:hypothetical protein
MERVLRQLQSEIAGFDLRLADDFRLLKSSCGMKARTDAEVIRIIKQLAAEGRLPLPFSVAAEALTLPQPHGEAVGSTIADESTLCETAATAEA